MAKAQCRKWAEAGGHDGPRCWDDGLRAAPEQPLMCVTRGEAQNYAAWVGAAEAAWRGGTPFTPGRWGNPRGNEQMG